MTLDSLRKLLPFATEHQAVKIQARIDHGSHRAAARSIGCSESLIRRAIQSAQRRSGMKPKTKPGWVPVEVTEHFDDSGRVTGKSVREAPEGWAEEGGEDAGPARDGTDGYVVKGVSTYYNAAGEQRGQWVKTRLDDQMRQTAVDAAMQALAESLPRVAPVAGPPAAASKLLNLYTLTDAHVGMLAWHKEGGADWDLRIAEDTLVGAFAHMIATAPRGRVAVINQLGDWLHFDGLKAVTPASGHLLDADGRFRKIVTVAVRILRRVIDMALETHDTVHVVCAEGNHDEASSNWLAVLLQAVYENEPRITVDDSPLPFYRYTFGSVFLGFHHGHLRGKESLPLLFVQQFRDQWGSTKHSYIHTGHRHHREEKDVMGILMVEHATLAARDAYAARHGYIAARQALAITYHEDFGEVARSTVTPEMLQ